MIIPKKGQRSGHYLLCENCGTKIYQTNTQFNRAVHHFCSDKCQKEFLHKQTFEDRECPICHCKFNVSKKSSQFLCSTSCQKIWQTKQTGKLNWKFSRVKILCETCGKEYYVRKYKLYNNQHNFCSLECKRKWYAECWSQTKEWKDASRKRAIAILKHNPIITNTKPQQIVNHILTEMGVDFENEYDCKYYSIDNFLSKSKLMIEVMGDFWHSNPKNNNINSLKPIQKQRIPRDKEKHNYILNKYDVEILYLWENDIDNNVELCKNLIQKYIMNNGKLIDYNSFNYRMENKALKLNKNIIFPFFLT